MWRYLNMCLSCRYWGIDFGPCLLVRFLEILHDSNVWWIGQNGVYILCYFRTWKLLRYYETNISVLIFQSMFKLLTLIALCSVLIFQRMFIFFFMIFQSMFKWYQFYIDCLIDDDMILVLSWISDCYLICISSSLRDM